MSEKLHPEKVKRIIDKIFKVFTNVILKYGGYIDKYEGDLIMALFGSKQTSETDTERAIRSGLEILNKLKQINEMLKYRNFELGVRIGINTGLVTTGKIGLGRVGDFTVYGDPVNMASRMESNAPINSIMISSETKKLVPDIFQFDGLGKIEVKGKSQPVEVYKVVGIAPRKVERWERSKLIQKPEYVGRDKELNKIENLYEESKSMIGKTDLEYKPVVIGLRGPAGLGKSRLIYEFIQRTKKKHKLNHLENIKISGYTKSYAQAPYTLWTSLIKNYVGINEIDTKEIIRDKFENSYSQISNELTRNKKKNFEKAKPILGFILGLVYEDIRLEKPDLKSLQAEIFLAIRYFLEAITKIANKQKYPMIIILEDLHWIDESSLNAFKTILSSLNVEEKRSKKPSKIIFFLLTYRNEFKLIREFKYRTDFFEFQLQPLTTDNSDLMIKSMLGKIDIPQKTKTELLTKSEGNPFYIEEWIHLLLDEDIIVMKDDKWQIKKEISTIPDTLNKLILSRIDRMEETLKTFLQKASVIGYSFLQSILEAIEKKLGNEQPIEPKLSELINLDWLKKEKEVNEADAQYLFKHIITCDVTYQTILFYNKKILHKIIAVFVEEKFKDNKGYYAFLANHYERAEVIEKAIEYLEKAGDFAKENYQNENTIELYDKLLKILDLQLTSTILRAGFILDTKRIDILHKKGAVLQLIGEWKDAKQIFKEALSLSEKLNDKKRIGTSIGSLGWQFYLKGDYDEAMECYEKGLKIAEKLGNKREISKTVVNMGIIYMNKGDYDEAMESYEKGLKIVEELGDKRGISITVGNMGIIYMNKGDYDKAMECIEKELKILEALGDKKIIPAAIGNMGVVYEKKGDYDKAIVCYEKELKIAEELGDKKIISAAIGNMGVIYQEKGDYNIAMECYEKELKIAEELGNKRVISIAVGNMGTIYYNKGNYDKAMGCYDKAISLGKELEIRFDLSEFLINKAELLFFLKRFNVSEIINEEGLNIANEIGRKDITFKGKVLSAKIDFVLAKDDTSQNNAISKLKEMLSKAEDNEHKAALNYELEIMNKELKRDTISNQHKKEALRLYKKLYKKTPNIEYKNRVKELEEI